LTIRDFQPNGWVSPGCYDEALPPVTHSCACDV
jgi:hypothetical protein